MTTVRLCKECGAPLPADAPEGLCPQCLMKGGLPIGSASAAATVTEPEATGIHLSPEEQPGDRIGHYKLLQKIGEGGYGAVYMADQEEPVRRRVALKVIKLGMDTKQVIARFEAERQALAMMDHPNIAKVLDAGTTDTGRPFFVMELVRGIRINEYCDQNKLSTNERLGLFKQICHAIQHAHQKGIIHRDIKPTNILVTLHDGVPVPKVIDFGIAKATQQRLTDKTLFTAFEQFIGTPAYMSPEQAEMSGLDIDTRSDIYSLGVLLYELLTGRTPFDQKDLLKAGLDEMRRIIREKEPPKPSTRLSTLGDADLTSVANHRHSEALKLVNLIRGDLDWIVMKALEKDRTRRYETANAFARDLEHYLNNEPVSAVAPSAMYQLRKFARRHRAALAAACAMVALLVAGIVVSGWQAFRAMRFANDANAQRLQAEAAGREAEKARANEFAERQKFEEKSRQLAETLSQQEQQKINEVFAKEGAAKALAYLARALRRNPDNYRAAYRLLSTLSHQGVARLASQKKYEGQLRDTCYSVLGPLVLTTTEGRDVWLWDYRKEQPLAGPLRHKVSVVSATFAPSGRKFTVTLTNSVTEVWLTTNTAAPSCLLQTDFLPGIVYSADESRAVTSDSGYGAYRTRTLRVWDLHTGQPLTRPVRYETSNYGATTAFTADGKQVSITEFGGMQRTQWTLDIAAGTLGPKQTMGNVSYPMDEASSGRPQVTYNDQQGTVQVSRLGEYRMVLLPLVSVMERTDYGSMIPLLPVSSQNLSPDGGELLTARGLLYTVADGNVSLWDLRSRGIIPIRIALRRPPTGVTYSYPQGADYVELSGDGRRLLTVDREATAKIWDPQTSKALLDPLAASGNVVLARLSPDGQKALTAATNHWMRLWDIATGKPLTEPFRDAPSAKTTKEKVNLSQVSFSPDGRWLGAAWGDGAVQVWNAQDAKLLIEVAAHRSPALLVVFSPDGKRLATVGQDRTARVWEVASGAAVTPPLKHDDSITSCRFSPDGRTLATASRDKTARIWNLQTGQTTRPPFKHEAAVDSIAFHPDGALLVTVAGDQTARIWDVKTGAIVQTIKAETSMQGATLAPDGRFLLLLSYDGMRVWDVSTGTPLTDQISTRVGASYYVPQVGQGFSLSADGYSLAMLAGDTVRVWALPRINGPVPAWLPQLAETMAAQRITEQGLTERVASGEFLALRQSILSGAGGDVYGQWARWFFADRLSATISPVSPVTMDGHVKACIEENSAASLQEALVLEPDNVEAISGYLASTVESIVPYEAQQPTLGRDEEGNRRQIRSNARNYEVLADRLLEAIPDSSVGWRVKALALHLLDQNEAALAALAHANPAQLGAAYWNTRAMVLEKLSRHNEAYQALTRAIELAPANARQGPKFFYLQRSRFLKRQNRLPEAAKDQCLALGIPPRDPAAKPSLIDLSTAYTCPLTNLDLLGGLGAGNDALAELPVGVHTLGGTEFDIRGIVCPRQRYANNRSAPASVPVNMRCRSLQFLQGAAYAVQQGDGMRAANYTVHFADGRTQEIPVLVGKHIRDWFYYEFQPEATEAPVVWVGSSARPGSFLRLYRMSWTNPFPDAEITSVDLELGGNQGMLTPFLIALTAETGNLDTPSAPPSTGSLLEQVRQQTLETLDQALARRPDYLPFTVAKAALFAQSGRTNEAVALFSKLIVGVEAKGPAATNELTAALYGRFSLLKRLHRLAEAQADLLRAKKIQPRDPKASSKLIDLSAFYTHSLLESLHWVPDNDLAELTPLGVKEFPAVPGLQFDVRGLVQLSARRLLGSGAELPEAVTNIAVGVNCRRIHLLHSAAWANGDPGTLVGSLVINYADAQQRRIDLKLGDDLWDWHFDPENPKPTKNSKVAWTGSNGRSQAEGHRIQLFLTSWNNPRPDVVVKTIDYTSAMNDPAPFLIAITVE